MKICFFTTTDFSLVKNESYTFNDFNYLKNTYQEVIFASKFSEIPWDCDLYFSWWLSGSFYPLVIAKLVRKPIIVVAGGNEAQVVYDNYYQKYYGYKVSPWYKKIATHIVSLYANEVLAVSLHLKKGYESLFKRKCKLVYNAVDLERFILPSEDVQPKYITFISSTEKNIAEIKRLEIFLKALGQLPKNFNYPIIILGRIGNYHQHYLELAKSLNIAHFVNFIGHVDVNMMSYYFQNSRLFIQISEVETFGLAVAEALACGTPVIVSKKGALPEVVGDCGFYVDHNSATSVCEGIMHALAVTEYDNYSIKKARRERIQLLFSTQNRFKAIKEIINNLI